MTGYGINRFTSTISVSVPAGYSVIGSGKQTAGPVPEVTVDAGTARKPAPSRSSPAKTSVPAGYKTYTFTYEDRPSFPGTVLIGKYEATKSTEGGLNLTVYTTPEHKALAQEYADTAVKEFFFGTTTFGPPYGNTLNVVELPNDT